MALDADLFGLDHTGAIMWRWPCRHWNSSALLTMFKAKLEPSDPHPSWECALTVDEVRNLSRQFDSPDTDARYPDDPRLSELLTTDSVRRIVLRLEEWGFDGD